MFSLSCTKTETPKSLLDINQTPIAKAVGDLRIFLPDQERLILDGSDSYDPDGAGQGLTGSWRKLSGDSVIMGLEQGFKKEVFFLFPGKYLFELSISDAKGAMAKDTVDVDASVLSGCDLNQRFVSAEFRSVDQFASNLLSTTHAASAAMGSTKLFFGGGMTEHFYDVDNPPSAGVLMYDIVAKVWKVFNLSAARASLAVAANDKLVLFAGGDAYSVPTERVDIFDQSTEKFSISKVSVARTGMAAAAVGSTFIFAGGMESSTKYSDVVDIYDINTSSWSVAKLSEPRSRISTLVSGSKVYFSGGENASNTPSNRVDIYDQANGQWSIATMALPRMDVQSTIFGNKIVYMGGFNDNRGYDRSKVNKAEFFDISTLSSTLQCASANSNRYPLAYNKTYQAVVTLGDSFYYLSDYLISRYDAGKNSWSKAIIPSTYNLTGLFVFKNVLYATGYMDSKMYIFSVIM